MDVSWHVAGAGAHPELGTSEIHVWRVDASSIPEPGPLSPDERARAAQFLNESARMRFAACRTALRKILAGYLAAEPEELEFRYGPHGKPSLKRGNRLDLRFNCSHSHDIALIAVTRGREAGIDVERVRTDMDCLSIAERFFAPGEIDFVRQAAPDDRYLAFFACWTRKEAWMKAAGVGFSKPPQAFDVSCSLQSCGANAKAATPLSGGWLLFPLNIDPKTCGAIVVEAVHPATAACGA